MRELSSMGPGVQYCNHNFIVVKGMGSCHDGLLPFAHATMACCPLLEIRLEYDKAFAV